MRAKKKLLPACSGVQALAEVPVDLDMFSEEIQRAGGQRVAVFEKVERAFSDLGEEHTDRVGKA